MSRIDARENTRKAAKESSSPQPDINPAEYTDQAKKHARIHSLRELSEEVKERSATVGIVTDEACRSGSFFQIDHSVILSSARHSGLEIMDITDALKTYERIHDFWWKAVTADADTFTAQAEQKQTRGYFLRALPGAKIEFPMQACLFLSEEGLAQNVHNIIIAEENSELHIITGCASARKVKKGLHIGVSEIYVKRNARVTFTMIHNWAEDMAVRPRSAAIVEQNGVFLSNYICMKPVRSIQMYPTVYCLGENATVRFNSILFAHKGSHIDAGSRVYLRAKGSKAEITSRAVTVGGDIIARGHLIGEVPNIKAHLECRGLILSEKGYIHAIPELEGKVSNIDMSHEAAVGKIAEEEIHYLMARGLSEQEATAAIVRGFLDVEIKGLPERLMNEIKKAVSIGERDKRLL